jgi:hypothetical protein
LVSFLPTDSSLKHLITEAAHPSLPEKGEDLMLAAKLLMVSVPLLSVICNLQKERKKMSNNRRCRIYI